MKLAYPCVPARASRPGILTPSAARDIGTQMTETTTAGAAVKGTSRIFNRQSAMVLLGLLAAIAPFIAILCLGVPSWFPAAVTLDTVTVVRPGAVWNDPAWSLAGRLIWSLLLVIGVAALMNLRGWWGRWLPLAVLLAGLAIPQACIWSAGQSKSVEIGGLLPFSDASGYLYYACEMLQNHRIVAGFSDRPMFAAMLSSLLQFTGLNLQAVLAILLAFCGAGMFLAAREMHARFGTIATVCFLFIIYVFYNRSIGTLMTEHLGLALSLYAFPLLLRGLMEPRRGLWLAGMFFLSAALWARAGALFVLPVLCLLTGRHFRNSGRFSLRMFALAIAVICIPFALDRLLLVRLFDKATRPKSNFSYAAYGMVRGTNWHDANDTYGSDQAKIRAATLEIIRRKPFAIPRAMRRAWLAFFWDSQGFSFMGLDWSRHLLYAFLFGIALGLARASRSPYDGFTVAVGGGILLSIPFVPPWDCDSMRAYAATMPLHACLAATGIGALIRLLAPAFRRGNSAPVQLIETRTIPSSAPVIAVAFGNLALFLVFVVPLGRTLLTPRNRGYPAVAGALEFRDANSSTGWTPFAQFPTAFSINLVSDDWPRTRVPNVRISDFRAQLGGFGGHIYKTEADWLARLPQGITLSNWSYLRLLVLPTDKIGRAGSHVTVTDFNVGHLRLSKDVELSLPNLEDAPSVPVPEKAESR